MGAGSRAPGLRRWFYWTSCTSGQVGLKVPPVQDLSCREFVLKVTFVLIMSHRVKVQITQKHLKPVGGNY